ncbi:MAG: phosphoheptose isomerase family protein [Candidatus Latescibacterota bacterium]
MSHLDKPRCNAFPGAVSDGNCPEIPVSSLQSDNSIPRRRALRNLLGLSSLPLAAALPSCTLGKRSPGMEYARALRTVLERIREKESDSIRDAANLFAHTIIARHLCFLATADPQHTGYLGEDTPGLPRIFVYLRSREMAETIQPGDAALATALGELTGLSRVRGAKLAGITSPAVSDDYSPEECKKLTKAPAMGESADIVIRTRLPLWDGLVTIPEYPFGILPGAGVVELATVTALAGEVYRRTEKTMRVEGVGPRDAMEFLRTVVKRMEKVRQQEENFAKAATLLGKKVRSSGTLWVYDRRGALARELARESGAPVFARPITKEQITDGTLRVIDGLIFASLESNLPEDLHLIRMARGITQAVVTICPRAEGGGYRIYNEAPAGLDNLSPEKEGVRKFDNNARTYLHTGGILNLTLFWMLLGEVIGYLMNGGNIPCCLMGSHLSGYVVYNEEARKKARERGY